MKFIRNISEDEMIVTFLQGELKSDRFGSDLLEKVNATNLDKNIIINPKLNNPQESSQRKNLFGTYRGYGKDEELFHNFPKNGDWKEAIIDKYELLNIYHIDYSYWNKLSNNTRLPVEAVKRIINNEKIYDVSNDIFIKAAEALNNGIQFLNMILVTKDKGSRLVVLEGHLRLTAYILNFKNSPEQIKVIVGYSKDFDTCGLY